MDRPTTPYAMCINNLARYIRSDENQAEVDHGDALTAFSVSTVLAIAFCKSQEEVLLDLVKAGAEP